MTKKNRNKKVVNRKIKSLLKHPLLKDAMKSFYEQMLIYGYVSDKTMDEYINKISQEVKQK